MRWHRQYGLKTML